MLQKPKQYQKVLPTESKYRRKKPQYFDRMSGLKNTQPWQCCHYCSITISQIFLGVATRLHHYCSSITIAYFIHVLPQHYPVSPSCSQMLLASQIICYIPVQCILQNIIFLILNALRIIRLESSKSLVIKGKLRQKIDSIHNQAGVSF